MLGMLGLFEYLTKKEAEIQLSQRWLQLIQTWEWLIQAWDSCTRVRDSCSGEKVGRVGTVLVIRFESDISCIVYHLYGLTGVEPKVDVPM